MTDDLVSQLQNLQNVRELLGEATYQQNLDKLRQRYGAEEVNALLQQPSPPSPTPTTDAQHSQGFVDHPTGPVDQHFGDDVQGDKISGTATTEGDNKGQTFGLVSNSTVIQQITYGTQPNEDKSLLIAYLNNLPGVCDALPLTTTEASSERPLTLQDVYIALDATYQPPHVLHPQEDIEKEQERERRTVLSVFCDDKHPQPPRMLLLGGPGMGKSTLVNYLTLCLAEANLDSSSADEWLARMPAWNYGALLPVRVVLREFAACTAVGQATRGSVDLLRTFLSDSEANSCPVPEETVKLLDRHLLATSPQAVLLFDGLDEVVGDVVLTRTVEMIAAAARTYRAAPLLVTCRVLDYNDSDTRQLLVKQHGLRRSELLPLDEKQIERFIEAWYQSYRVRGRAIRGDEAGLLAALQRRSELREMADSPLLLTMMAIVHASGRLPETRAELYHRCIEQLLIEWRKEQGKPDVLDQLGISGFGRDALLDLMASLGYETHTNADRDETSRKRAADLGRDQAQAIIEKTLGDYIKGDNRDDRCETKAREIINRIARRNGLLLKHSERVYRFAHRSFQEFLAGYALINRPNAVQQWLQHTTDIHWHEAIQLMIGLMASSGTEIEKPLDLIAQLNERSGVERALAGELLHLVGQGRVERYNRSLRSVGSAERTVWEDTLGSLINLIETTDPAHAPVAVRIRGARALADLGDPRFPVTIEQWQTASTALADLSPTPDPLSYWRYVPGGTYQIGGWEDEEGEKLESADIDLPDYWIARYPITVAQYRQFIEAGGYDQQEYWTPNGWQWRRNENRTQPWIWNNTRYSGPNQAVIGVTWYEAAAFVRWLNAQLAEVLPAGWVARLPTEAEWEAAAAYDGPGTQQRVYPWGSEPAPDTERAIFKESGLGAPAPVGVCAAGAAACGALDMVGQVWEWTADVWRSHSGAKKTFEDKSSRVLKGAYWGGNRTNVRCAARGWDHPDVWDSNIGFRPVVSPPRAN